MFFAPVRSVEGELKLPGDKSISHRAVIFSALAKGKSSIKNCLNSADVNSTIEVFRSLGAEIERNDNTVIVKGRGFKGFEAPRDFLNAGNSGTTARLIAGILTAQNFPSVIIGDASLSRRPMGRIVEPLNMMGAKIEAAEGGTLPLKIFPSDSLHAIEYLLPVASAQVKSAVLLAGLHLDEITRVIEPISTRNHTEKMLNLKVHREEKANIIEVSSADYPEPKEYSVPSDISTAAFFIVLTLLTKNSELLIRNVLLNDTRAGVLKILERMGAVIEKSHVEELDGEMRGDLLVRSSELENVKIEADVIPNIIDEIPILSVAGLFAKGKFVIRGAQELRKKESDRIKSLCENYAKIGVEVNEFDDGFELIGEPKVKYGEFESFGDHRIAMTFAVLSMLLEEGGVVEDFECVEISNPAFIEQIQKISVA